MQWNCPHCHTHLSIKNETMQSGWNFSKCFKCGGFALVRKAEINLIKVDHIPKSEKILSTEEVPPPPQQMIPEPLPELSEPNVPNEFNKLMDQNLTPIQKRRDPWLNIGIAITALITAGSGIFLFIQGQALWKKTTATPKVKIQVAPIKEENQSAQMTRDELATQMSAPVKTEPKKLLIQPKVKGASLRMGPGLEYPIVGVATLETTYEVIDWNDRWFKILLPENELPDLLERSAWIRNDLIQTPL